MPKAPHVAVALNGDGNPALEDNTGGNSGSFLPGDNQTMSQPHLSIPISFGVMDLEQWMREVGKVARNQMTSQTKGIQRAECLIASSQGGLILKVANCSDPTRSRLTLLALTRRRREK
jgi:hypothetical protein